MTMLTAAAAMHSLPKSAVAEAPAFQAKAPYMGKIQ